MSSFKETFQVFIERNSNINIQNNFKQTVLHLAVNNSNLMVVLMLINQPGINLDVSILFINSKYLFILILILKRLKI
jgi:ankyrin repeat protein